MPGTCTNAHIGRKQAIGFAKETTSGTLSAGTKYRFAKESGIMKPVIESVTDESGYGVIESTYDSQVAKETSSVQATGLVRDISIGLLLKAAFGGETSTAKIAPNASVYDHLFTVQQDNNHPSLSAWAYDPVGTYTTTYNMLNELKISGTKMEFVKCDISLIGKKMATASTPTVSYASDNNFLARHVNLYIADTEIGLDSATALPLNSFEVVISKNVEMTGIGLEPDCLLNQNFVVSGNFEAIFVNNSDWLALVQGATEKFFRIQIKNTDITIGSTANPELSFTFAKAVFNEWDKSSDNNAIVTQTVGFVGAFNNASGFSVKAKLTNTQSAVY